MDWKGFSPTWGSPAPSPPPTVALDAAWGRRTVSNPNWVKLEGAQLQDRLIRTINPRPDLRERNRKKREKKVIQIDSKFHQTLTLESPNPSKDENEHRVLPGPSSRRRHRHRAEKDCGVGFHRRVGIRPSYPTARARSAKGTTVALLDGAARGSSRTRAPARGAAMAPPPPLPPLDAMRGCWLHSARMREKGRERMRLGLQGEAPTR